MCSMGMRAFASAVPPCTHSLPLLTFLSSRSAMINVSRGEDSAAGMSKHLKTRR